MQRAIIMYIKQEEILGKTVEVTVDRPLGSYHPNHRDICYPVNYGYIEGILGGDGEWLVAYILNFCAFAFFYKIVYYIFKNFNLINSNGRNILL